MTREEAIRELSYIADEMPSMECGDWKEAIDMAIKALEQEPCDDVVSRQWLMECVNEGWIKFDTEKDKNRFIHLIRDIAPPVTPQPKVGRWIRISPAGIYECSECGQNVMTSDICAYKFCHGCGAEMVEPQESEV